MESVIYFTKSIMMPYTLFVSEKKEAEFSSSITFGTQAAQCGLSCVSAIVVPSMGDIGREASACRQPNVPVY